MSPPTSVSYDTGAKKVLGGETRLEKPSLCLRTLGSFISSSGHQGNMCNPEK